MKTQFRACQQIKKKRVHTEHSDRRNNGTFETEQRCIILLRWLYDAAESILRSVLESSFSPWLPVVSHQLVCVLCCIKHTEDLYNLILHQMSCSCYIDKSDVSVQSLPSCLKFGSQQNCVKTFLLWFQKRYWFTLFYTITSSSDFWYHDNPNATFKPTLLHSNLVVPPCIFCLFFFLFELTDATYFTRKGKIIVCDFVTLLLVCPFCILKTHGGAIATTMEEDPCPL